MADDLSQPEAAPSTEPEEEPVPQRLGWSNLWQFPTIILSLVLIAGGIYTASKRPPEHDFDGAFSQIDDLIATRQHEVAAQLLQDQIRPYLEYATDQEQGRYFALAGTILARSIVQQNTARVADAVEVGRRFERAEALGHVLRPDDHETWATASLMVGDITTARHRLAALDFQTLDEVFGEAAEAARGRVLRALVERSLREPDLPFVEAMDVLGEYRANPKIEIGDEIWAVARQTELRLESGSAREAVDRLVIDMRRIEPRLDETDSHFGELYTLLARGFYELGEFSFALEQVSHALELFDSLDARCADTYVALGRVLLAQSRFEEAFDAFAVVGADYEGTHGTLPGLLGRAEVHGILGHHQESHDEYRELARQLPLGGPRRDVTPARVVGTLIDRHDAALATTKLGLALNYIELTEGFFHRSDLPDIALIRLASTNRLIADQLIADSREQRDGVQLEYLRIDPAIRREATAHFKRAGDYFAQHAGAAQGNPLEEKAWRESQLSAADSYDLAGYYNLAIQYFREYVAGRSEADPDRVTAQYRLARCHQAMQEFPEAVVLFEGVIRQNPTSTVAAQCHVPLAACYESLGSTSQAEQQLLGVVSGGEPLAPDSTDYRDALFALGTLYFNQQDHIRAIEELHKAVQYYPDDPRITAMTYRLAESYRGNARTIEAKLAEGSMPRTILVETTALRQRQLREAIMLFTKVCEAYESMGRNTLDSLQGDYLRYAYLNRADCSFNLDEFDTAIEWYDEAARRYADHPSALVALIQIVNAYTRMDDRQRALTAHQRVLVRLQQMPPGSLDSIDSVLGERAWRRWLEDLPPGIGLSQGQQN